MAGPTRHRNVRDQRSTDGTRGSTIVNPTELGEASPARPCSFAGRGPRFACYRDRQVAVPPTRCLRAASLLRAVGVTGDGSTSRIGCPLEIRREAPPGPSLSPPPRGRRCSAHYPEPRRVKPPRVANHGPDLRRGGAGGRRGRGVHRGPWPSGPASSLAALKPT